MKNYNQQPSQSSLKILALIQKLETLIKEITTKLNDFASVANSNIQTQVEELNQEIDTLIEEIKTKLTEFGSGQTPEAQAQVSYQVRF